MKLSTLELICCPSCKTTLSLNVEAEGGIVLNGELSCSTCNRRYPIKNRIVHFINPGELEGQNQHFERYYNRLAPFYSLFSKFALLPFGGERKARMEILDHLDLNGGRTLEVSIGNGVNLPYLQELDGAGEVFGIDISFGQLKHCQRLTNKRGWQVDLFLAMAESLPFKDEVFHNVLHIGGINFFSDKKAAIQEMARVVRPGGKVVISDEAERLAKQVSRSKKTTDLEQGGGTIEKNIANLVSDGMQDVQMEGIWKMHGKDHGYCLHFRKPESPLYKDLEKKE